MATAAVERYWAHLVMDGCLITGGPAEIAHCHGGSIVERMGEKAKGVKLPRMDWLVLPLDPRLHRLHSSALRRQGFIALDYDVEAWEAKYGRQADHIDGLCARYDLDLWNLAAPTKGMLPRRVEA